MKNYIFLEPIKIGKLTLKNRIISAAMARHICEDDGFVSDAYVAHYESIAKGGAAAIIPGIMVIDPTWPYISQGQPYLSDDKYIPGLKRAIDAVHAHDAKFFCQLWHSGLASTTISVNDLTLDEIHHIQDLYVSAAGRSKAAGADGVEFHIAHTYLPNQFLSPYFNKRTDEYGSGTVEDGLRFSLECIQRIRELYADDNFEIIAKINANDFVEGGMTPERAAEAAVLLEKAGIAMITVSGGGALTGVHKMSDDGREEEGWKIPLARAVKERVAIPVAGGGSLRHPEYIDEIIRNGDCDIAAIARGLYAEPEWVEKVSSGRENELKSCISCMFCFTNVKPGTASGCSVNPFAKRELEKPDMKKDGEGRKVVIVGAGPSGLEAAVTLAERGFSPVILEKRNRLGGLVYLAAKPPGKKKLGWMIDYYDAQIKRLDIDVRFNVNDVNAEIEKINPYAVIFATGSNEFVPPIDGIKNENVVSARDVLDGVKSVNGKNIVVLGGGLTGLETARFVKNKDNSVIVLEMMPVNPTPNMETKLALGDAKHEGIEVYNEHKVVSIEYDSVRTMNLTDDKEVVFKADFVIVSMGIRANNEPEAEIGNMIGNKYAVGDCAMPGKISTAVQSGSDAAYALK